ncbi:unnamed protein product [Urochloa humidicola]
MTKYMRNKKSSPRQLKSLHNLIPNSHCTFKKVASQELAFAATEKCAWTDATCPICMEFPHNAVLLLCSSHGSGCRPYICASNFQHSNCLDQLVESCRKGSSEDTDAMELACPLCRGEVKGYTLVEPARKKLNRKRRSCMQDGCSYMGTYRELCKHVKKKHPSANPRAVDPLHASRWKRLLFRSSLQDMICSATSPFLRRLLSAMLQFDEFIAGEGGDPRGATDDSSQPSADAEFATRGATDDGSQPSADAESATHGATDDSSQPSADAESATHGATDDSSQPSADAESATRDL